MHPEAGIGALRRVTPAAILAALGAGFLAGQLWIFIRWAADGHARPVAPTPENISTSHSTVTWTLQGMVLLAAVVFIGVVTRQCRRAGYITFDAALLLGYFFSSWQSPLINYEKIALVVTPHSLNVTTWGPYIPGWDSPQPLSQPETLLGVSGAGFGVLMTWVWIQAWLTGRIAQRFPGWTWRRLLPASVSAGFAVDFLIETLWRNTGFYSYTAAPSPLTPLHGYWAGPSLLYYVAVTLFISTPAVMLRPGAKTRADPLNLDRAPTLGSSPGNFVRMLAGVGLANLLLLTYFISCGLITRLLV
ncbi:spirocyclase AveC family protein [Amycolatopsis magusensis]|uniref:spirocyclase AveC family protein n=1 Tax=Amycolatopsis magusensis TaxID=882444 RepID=UPI0024A890DB|nr:spirocyclase AveC family protein [Amycolatopsis magusensis]MDI5979862.1 spirocyclase AveC family protein [Amycolatopsis magusensis]